MSIPQFSITTYEFDLDTKTYNPILGHVFWGKDPEQALAYAKSHLITDFFFSSSFVGTLQWKDSVLILRNKPELIGYGTQQELREILQELAVEARKVNAQQKLVGELQVIERLTK